MQDQQVRSEHRPRVVAAEPRPLRVGVTGASGLIGTELGVALTTAGAEVLRFVRHDASGPGEVSWDPSGGIVDAARIEGLDAVVHLSGRRIDTRWSQARKDEIWSSRVETTRVLAETLVGLERPPRVLLTASAVGFYGDRGEDELSEESPAGDGFLADLCRAWEAAAAPVTAVGARVVHARFGVILTTRGTPLSSAIRPFRLGLGAVLGDGRQYMSWVHLEDAVAAISYLLAEPSAAGPFNVTAPTPVTNREFTKTLAQTLGRPAWLRLPRLAVSAAFGEMGRETILASQRALPTRLVETGFEFSCPDLASALSRELRDD